MKNMVELPEVYVVESTQGLIQRLNNLTDDMSQEERKRTPEGEYVIQSFITNLNNKEYAEIHRYGLDHIKSMAEKYDKERCVEMLDESEQKSWSEEEIKEFRDMISM